MDSVSAYRAGEAEIRVEGAVADRQGQRGGVGAALRGGSGQSGRLCRIVLDDGGLPAVGGAVRVRAGHGSA